MDFKEKLNIYQKNKNSVTKEDNYLEKQAKIKDNIGGFSIDLNGIKFREFTDYLDLTKKYGDIELTEIQRPLDIIYKYSKLKTDIKPEELLFLDLETTSLSMGAGNYPFLIGLGYIEENFFVVKQYFMNDYSSEPAILEYILPYFQKAKTIVTYNGKSFDVPLIKNRYRLNRVPGFPMRIEQLDLIHHSRRIFKEVFENCKLQTMETELLGLYRIDDIPGWQIPEIWFDFQTENESKLIPDIIKHNLIDVNSMLILLYQLNNAYHLIEKKEFNLLKYQSIRTLAPHIFNIDKEIFMEMMAYLGDEIKSYERLLKLYSIALKQSNNYTKALKLWEADNSLFSLQELAKYHEHHEKNYKKAKQYCLNSKLLLIRLDENNLIEKNKYLQWNDDITRRLTRISKKESRG